MEGGRGRGSVHSYLKMLKIFWEKDPNFVQDLIREVRELDLSLYYNYVFGCSLEKKLLNFVTIRKRKHKKA